MTLDVYGLLHDPVKQVAVIWKRLNPPLYPDSSKTSRNPSLTVLANVTIELFALVCVTVQNETRTWWAVDSRAVWLRVRYPVAAGEGVRVEI
jgi:hypothetical protein